MARRFIVSLDDEMANKSPFIAGTSAQFKRAMRMSYLVSVLSEPTLLWVVGPKAAANIIAQEDKDMTRASVWTLAEVRDLLEPLGMRVANTYEAAMALAYDPTETPADSPIPHTVPVSHGTWTELHERDEDDDTEGC